MEMQLIDATAVVVTLQHRCIATPVVVGQHGSEQFHLRPFDAVQLDLQRAARAAMRGIQNMCGQSSHCSMGRCSGLVPDSGRTSSRVLNSPAHSGAGSLDWVGA